MVPEWAQETGQGLPEWAQEPGDVELAVQPTAAGAAASSTQAKFHEQEQPAERGGDAALPSWYFDDDKEEGKSGWDEPPQSDKIVTTDAPGRPPDLEDPEHRPGRRKRHFGGCRDRRGFWQSEPAPGPGGLQTDQSNRESEGGRSG